MAYGIHSSFLTRQTFKEKIYFSHPIIISIVLRYRNILRIILFFKKSIGKCSSNIVIGESFDLMKDHYQKEGWAYQEDILNNNFHKDVVDNWPSIMYFRPAINAYKYYDWGFVVNFKDNNPDYYWQKYTDTNSWYNIFVRYLSSSQFLDRVSRVSGMPMKIDFILLTLANQGSRLALHMDEEKKNLDNLTCVFFIDGVNEIDSGGLTLVNDNQWNDIIFQPVNILNSIIIFNKNNNFYHGFRRINKGKYRYALLCNFTPEE